MKSRGLGDVYKRQEGLLEGELFIGIQEEYPYTGVRVIKNKNRRSTKEQ
jgi:hypothetical protein